MQLIGFKYQTRLKTAQHLESPSAQAYPVLFTTAYTLLGLRSGCTLVDSTVSNLKSDTIALLKSSRLPLLAAERYCLRAQLPEFIGGPSGKSFFIDGGNGFDVYLFTSIAREHGLELDDALDNIIISRAFTPYELVQLIAKDANRVIDRYRPKLLVISNVFDLFSRDMETDEARRLMGKIRNAIFRINRSRRVPIVITARNRVEGIEPIVQEACNVEVEFVEERHQIVSRLLRHPSKLRMQIAGYVGDELYNQESLSPEAMTRG